MKRMESIHGSSGQLTEGSCLRSPRALISICICRTALSKLFAHETFSGWQPIRSGDQQGSEQPRRFGFIHDHLKAGDSIKISAPRNNFPLAEDAPHSIFVAGGIGITPIWSMIQRLEHLNRSWELHYSARLKRACAFRRDLIDLERARSGRVHFNFDHEPGGAVTDLNALMSRASREAHLYCCGPTAMLRAFESAVKADGRSPERIHTEYFTAAEEKAVEGHFTVVLARSGRSIEVPSGKTVLDALLDSNVDVPFSCMQGTCGTCETKVIEGMPDHRDAFLTPGERASNQTMMICCSGSKSSELVLDI